MDPPIAYTGAITAYLIQSALYCEYKPYIEASNQGRINPGLARKIARRTLETLKKVPRKGKAFVNMTLQGEVMGFPAVASPDAIYFEDGVAKAVIRGRIRPSLKDYRGDWAVLALSSLLLAQTTGQDLDTITLVLILGVGEKALHEALTRVKSGGPRPHKCKAYIIKTRVMTEIDVMSLLERPVKVLAGLEAPRLPDRGKCRRCPFREMCPVEGL